MDDDDLTKFKKINPKSEVKRFRITSDEKTKLDNFLNKYNLEFSDFAKHLIWTAIDSSEQKDYVKFNFKLKSKTHHRPPPKVDPDALYELGRIGTNVNQIARALNTIKNEIGSNLNLAEQFSFIECLQALQVIQDDLHSVVGEIKSPKQSDKAIQNARNRALMIVGEEPNAH
jgi:hypothetical protein